MKKVACILFMSACLLTGSLAGAAQVYEVDQAHSSLAFNVVHLMISKVTGDFMDYKADIVFDEKDLAGSRFDFEIKAESINTNNEARDNHLRGADFFDVSHFSMITFKTKKITSKGDVNYVVTGDLTMKDVTREIEIPVKVLGPVANPMGGRAIGIEAHFSINRQDYHVKWNKQLDNGGLMVADNVDVNVNLEAHAK